METYPVLRSVETMEQKQLSEGILSGLQLDGVGPATRFCFEPGNRLNLITGDNGLGKTFLLDAAWFVLSGQWAEFPSCPRTDSDKDGVRITFRLTDRSGQAVKKNVILYDWDRQQWEACESAFSSALIIYARVDRSFAVWDPVRGRLPIPAGGSRSLSPLILSKAEVWAGIKEEVRGKMGDRSLCNGLLWDWIHWQNTPHTSHFRLLTRILRQLSHGFREPLIPGDPVRIPGDSRPIPTLAHSYGDVPVVHAAASVQRMVAMAYLILWTYEEHKIACHNARRDPYKNMIVIIDELEAHLHPKWQRTVVPALLGISSHLNPDLNIQFLITTHSPLILAAAEPLFDPVCDRLFHLDYGEYPGTEVVLENAPFLQHGRVDNWFTSDVFGLGRARSLEAEKAIGDAEALQDKDAPDRADIRAVHNRLVRYLGDHDTFWAVWTWFAEQHGVKR